MKRLLIISPYFPPSNSADMQRIRMSLPYFKQFGWIPEVVFVDEKHSDTVKDPLLNLSIPDDIKTHKVNALSKKITTKFGLGSIALRSFIFYKKTVNSILKREHFDLIYFSTTQFAVCTLGAYWNKKFNIPYVIDMQDPWHSTYYLNKPKYEKPPKYWFSYRLNKYMEAAAMKSVGGLISVSESYIDKLRVRYCITHIPSSVITFGYFEKDFQITKTYYNTIKGAYVKEPGKINLVYIGRGGQDMIPAIRLFFKGFRSLLEEHYNRIENIRIHFIGTSYAPKGEGKPSFKLVAKEFQISNYVNELTDRIPFYEGIKSLLDADGLIIPGSDDPSYTASKIYPYILAQKPILGIFQPSSSAYHILSDANHAVANLNDEASALTCIKSFILRILSDDISTSPIPESFKIYSAQHMTQRQCELFNAVVKNSK